MTKKWEVAPVAQHKHQFIWLISARAYVRCAKCPAKFPAPTELTGKPYNGPVPEKYR